MIGSNFVRVDAALIKIVRRRLFCFFFFRLTEGTPEVGQDFLVHTSLSLSRTILNELFWVKLPLARGGRKL